MSFIYSFARDRKPGRWAMLIVASLSLLLLFVATWQAGKIWGQMEDERLTLDLNRLNEQVAQTRLELRQEQQQTANLRRELEKTGKSDSIALVHKLQKQLLQTQAEANQYKEVIQLEQRALSSNTQVVEALSNPGTHLMEMKPTEAGTDSTGYALVESSRMLFLASHLPAPPIGKQYQLWVMRREDPKLVSAGVFSPDGDRPRFDGFRRYQCALRNSRAGRH